MKSLIWVNFVKEHSQVIQTVCPHVFSAAKVDDVQHNRIKRVRTLAAPSQSYEHDTYYCK